jgi:3-methyl-2-oxobutanoate hydroxymethyltransferase
MTDLFSFEKAKKKRRKIAMMTAYDAPTAELLEAQGVDVILVGDSVAMVLLGYDHTAQVSMDEMLHHARAVLRGAKRSFVIGDLPLKGVEKGPRHALESSKKFIAAGCHAVKLEWNKDSLETVRLLKKDRIPAMGHIGLTPQTVQGGDFRVQGRQAEKAAELVRNALALEKAGAFAVLLECVPVSVAKVVTAKLKVPTIGIGAGPHCDGQVLVFNDAIGTFNKFRPRFVRTYASLYPQMEKAVKAFVRDVRGGGFPKRKECFLMPAEEEKRFLELSA